MSTTLVRRLEKLEANRQEAERRWLDEASATLLGTMAREHVKLLCDWCKQNPDAGSGPDGTQAETWYDWIARWQPPALIRAALLLLAQHWAGGVPLSLAPSVAEVYLADPDAFPADACDDCGYPRPVQSTIRPD